MFNMPAPNQTTPANRRAFTLVELLVVIAIIAVLISLLLPALAGVRNRGRSSATQNMMNAFTNAVSSFSNDNGSRMPGYFSESQMGHSDNEGAGLSAMENVLIELGGPDVVVGNYSDYSSDVNEEGGIIAVAPFAIGGGSGDEAVVINSKLIGSSGAYFAPDSKFLKVLDVGEGQQIVGNTSAGQQFMPDLVDAFGNPLLAWVQDTSARGSIDPNNTNPDGFLQFASRNSNGNGGFSGPAWFYLASNACFIGNNTVGIGENGNNQNAFSALSTRPLSNNSQINAEDRIRTLCTLLASPSYFALPPSADGSLDNAGVDEIYPARPRGALIVQSAGEDGYFLGTGDPGWRANAHTDGGDFHLAFGNNYKAGEDGDRYQDENGGYTTFDIVGEFDDILQSVN